MMGVHSPGAVKYVPETRIGGAEQIKNQSVLLKILLKYRGEGGI